MEEPLRNGTVQTRLTKANMSTSNVVILKAVQRKWTQIHPGCLKYISFFSSDSNKFHLKYSCKEAMFMFGQMFISPVHSVFTQINSTLLKKTETHTQYKWNVTLTDNSSPTVVTCICLYAFPLQLLLKASLNLQEDESKLYLFIDILSEFITSGLHLWLSLETLMLPKPRHSPNMFSMNQW